MTPRFTTCGKQIMLNGEHLADACDQDAAEAIAIVLAHARLYTAAMGVERFRKAMVLYRGEEV